MGVIKQIRKSIAKNGKLLDCWIHYLKTMNQNSLEIMKTLDPELMSSIKIQRGNYMEWRKISYPEQDDWEIQYDVVAYYGSHNIGKLVYSTEYGWQSVINGIVECLYDSETEDEAQIEFKERLENFLEGEVDFYRELISMLDDLK